MAYTVKQLAKLSGVSVRTLHFYDEKGLLAPSFVKENGYRYYEENELLRLQQILFFRELDFPLEEIKRILDASNFDMRSALNDHRALLVLKRKRLDGLLKTLDTTIQTMNKNQTPKDEELFSTFTKEEMDAYKAEAKERWGHTEAWRQSEEQTKNWTKKDYKRIAEENEKFMHTVLASMDKGPEHPDVQRLIAQHYDGLRAFYEPSPEMYRGLADLYVSDPRFKAYYDKYHTDMAAFMRDAMHAYADTLEA